MKKILFFILVSGAMTLSSCKEESFDGSAIEGKWKLERVEQKDDKDKWVEAQDVAKPQYWLFNDGKLTILSENIDSVPDTAIPIDYEMVDSTKFLKLMGVTTSSIEKLTSKEMILTTDGVPEPQDGKTFVPVRIEFVRL